MEIISWNFLVFLLITIPVYYTLNRRAQNIWLVVASAAFIATHGWQNLIPLTVIAGVTWLAGARLAETGRRGWLAAGIAVNVTALAFYRTATSPLVFPAGTIDHLLVPVGMSFYTLQSIGYLIDISHKKIEAEKDPVDLTLYLMYFPKFLAGPIERAGHFLPQLKEPRIVDNAKASRGFSFILFGLIRKVAVAEVLFTLIPKNFLLIPFVDMPLAVGLPPLHVATYIAPVSNIDRLIAVICYGLYLYNDFAGYTLIMRGISLLMGIELPPNFREPYFAATLSEFWSKWHISLSSWLRDYIYFPLTRWLKKKSPGAFPVIPIAVPLLVTMLTAGVWHGLTIPFLFWGLLYGIMLTLEQLAFQRWPSLRPQQRPFAYRLFSALLTFTIVSFAWVPFAARSWREIAAFPVYLSQPVLWTRSPEISPWAIIVAAFSFPLDVIQSLYRDWLSEAGISLPLRAAIVAAFLILLFLAFTWTKPYTSNVFIYQAF